jgi:hypothetical protein
MRTPSRPELIDFEWSIVEPLLPNKPRGIPAHRRCNVSLALRLNRATQRTVLSPTGSGRAAKALRRGDDQSTPSRPIKLSAGIDHQKLERPLCRSKSQCPFHA